MNKKSSRYIFVFVFSLTFTSVIFGQEVAPQPKNFSYTHNPSTKVKSPATNSPEKPSVDKDTPVENDNEIQNDNSGTDLVVVSAEENSEENLSSRSAANKTLEVVKRASLKNLAPTETYKIGAGDVLFISLQNAPAKESTYFTVLNDGTIDYPLAGEMVNVFGLTVEEMEDALRDKIKIYENPQVTIKIREYSSHSITVLGLVEKPGIKYLQREALPLYVVKAEAIIQSQANQAIIRRRSGETENISLKDTKSDELLILPGDIVEFLNSSSVKTSDGAAYFYIGGNIVSAGQKDFHNGMTLTQAILASGGLSKSNARKIIVSRKNSAGLLTPTEFDLREIKNGKIPDPEILVGDTIEILK